MNDARADRFHASITDRTASVAIVGQGYVGLPVAMRASELGFRVVGFDVDTARIEAPARRSLLRRGRPRRAARGRARARATSRPAIPTTSRGFDVAVITRADAAARRRARPLVHRGRRRHPARRTSARRAGRPRVDHLPRHDRGAAAARSSRRSGLGAGADFLLGYSPERIDPGNTDVDAS